ncbi:MAG: superoxide dismutase [Candidatus Pelagibacter sp.]|nr:superoxide dismutase [Candidatus Pelagibacter sp.]|tara:strand:+ start:5928 stop:6521 length:594 start_codon:yes stop_codon:yes gene_type:complete
MNFELPKLDYAKNGLSPVMSEETLDLHYGKHHQTYVTNLNNLIKDTEYANISLEEILKKTANDSTKSGIFNNAGQHWNHLLFWKCMKPKGGGTMPTKLEKKIIEDFGSIEKFKTEFIQAGVTQFGSGWAWLALDNNKLVVTKSSNASNPIVNNLKPILGCDVWEHAYYVDFKNRRPDYIKAFLDHLVNWEYVSSLLD